MARVLDLWRYPVKSMQGERAAELAFGRDGVAGDRAYGVLDVGRGTVVSAKREGRMLQASARLVDGGSVAVRLPGRAELPPGPELDAGLGELLGRPCRLVRAAEHGAAVYERLTDEEDDDSEPSRFSGPAGSFVDQSHVHLLSTAILQAMGLERPDLDWVPRRFRPNLVLEDEEADRDELGRIGGRIRVGEVELAVTGPCIRCALPTRPQPGALERRLDILRHLSRFHDRILGVRAQVAVPGVVRVGDPVRVGTLR